MEFFSNLSQRFGARRSERMDFFSILSQRFGVRWSERMEFCFSSSHKDLAPGGDTHDPKCHEPQIGVPKMDTWRGCDDLSLARPDP
jgi:hypothetical protein